MKLMGWRSLAIVVAAVITLYLAGSWTALPGIAVSDVIEMCEQPYMGWHIWHVCPDRMPRTTEVAGAVMGLSAVAWVAWIGGRRIGRAFGGGKMPNTSE